MAKKRLNRKVALIGFIFFVFIVIAIIGGFIYLSGNPEKFMKDGDAAILSAHQTTDKDQRKELYKQAERNYRKAFGHSKTDEFKIEMLYRLMDLYLDTEEWRDVMSCWNSIIRLDSKDIKARYNRLKYFYIIAQIIPGPVWQEIAAQSSELIDIIEKPGASSEIAAADISKWEIDQLKQPGDSSHKLGPYLHLIRGKANFSIAKLGMVTNKEESLKSAIADFEKVKQLEPQNPDSYTFLAQATAFAGDIEASKGNLDAKTKAQQDAIELLNEANKATNNDISINITLLNMKHEFSFAQSASSESDLQKRLLAMEPDYLSLVSKFPSSAEAFASLAGFYADFRLGVTHLGKAIESAEKAMSLDPNSVDYASMAANLYSRRYNINNEKHDFDKTIEIAKNALLLPDSQETTGPRSAAVRFNQLRLHSILAANYIDQLLDSTALSDEDAQQILSIAQQEIRQIEQLYGSGDDPQVIKWQAMVELASAKLSKGDVGPAVRKLYKTYTHLKASSRSDAYLSYRLAKTFSFGVENGAVGQFLSDALLNGIELSHPESRLNYADLVLKAGMWKMALSHIDLFEQRCGVTDKSGALRIRAYIGAREFADAEKYLAQLPQNNPSLVELKLALFEGRCSQLRGIISRRDEKLKTNVALMNAMTQKQTLPADQRSTEQLITEMKTNLSAFIEFINKLSKEDLNSIENAYTASICDAAISSGQIEMAKQITDKFSENVPDNSTYIFYKRLLMEQEPSKVTPERMKQIREDIYSGIQDPVKRAILLGMFYQTNNDQNSALQFKKLIAPPIGTGEMQAPDSIRRQATGYLFDIAIEKKDWDMVDKIVQIAKQENYDDCSGDFFAARVALAKQQYETGLANIDSALAQRPVFGFGYLLRSRINAGLGKDEAALNDIFNASKMNPFDKSIARELASRLYTRNQNLGQNVSSAQLAEAKNALDWALTLNPGDGQLMSFYAEYISDTDPQAALALRQSLQENKPSLQNALLLARLAMRLASDSSNEQRSQALLAMADSALKQAENYEPQNPAVLEMRSIYYKQTGQEEKAESLLKTAQQSQLLWQFYIKAGRYDDARKSLEADYKNNPKDEKTLQGLSFIAEKTQDKNALIKYSDELLAAWETPSSYLQVIQSYLNIGLIKEAEKKLGSFMEKYPNDGNGLLFASWLAMKQGNFKEALDLINKRLEADQTDSIAWRIRGQINSLTGNSDQAISDLKRSKSLSDIPPTRIGLARAYLKTGRTEEAAIELKSIVEDPQAPDEARIMLEEIYSRQERTEALDEFYAKIIKQLPESVYWYKRAGGFAGGTGDFNQAEQLYHNALQKSIEQGQPDIDSLGGYLRALIASGKMDKLFVEAAKYIDGNLAPIAYIRMAEGKLKLGDRATAVQYSKTAVDKASNNELITVQMLQKIYELLGSQEAEQICKQKLDLEPQSLTSNWTMYNLLRLKGDYDKSLEHLEKCLTKFNQDQPQWLDYMTQKAELLILAFTKTSDKKYLKEAMTLYESLLAKMPNNTGILNNVAYILADNNEQLDKALEYSKRANELLPNDPGYLDTYAFVLYKKGSCSEALGFQESAVHQYEMQRNSVPLEAYENIAKIHTCVGDSTKARAAYEQALDAGGKSIKPADKERLTAAIEKLGKK